jgi:hypothetical protein
MVAILARPVFHARDRRLGATLTAAERDETSA